MTTSQLALPSLLTERNSSVLHAILGACNMGVLVTDLNFGGLASNAKFVEYFGVEPTAPTVEPTSFRRRLLDVLGEREPWLTGVEKVAREPERTFEDEITIRNSGVRVLRRYSAPIRDNTNQVIGRLWTFTDISEIRRQVDASDLLSRVSSLTDIEPSLVYRKILKEISRHFNNSTAIIAICQGDFMKFHAVEGPPSVLKITRGIDIDDGYCRRVLESKMPVAVQDAGEMERYMNSLPRKWGFNRYLGAPIVTADGSAVGTVYILDKKCDEIISDDDKRLMHLLATRVSAELNREQFIEEKVQTVQVQEKHLQETQKVLAGMNSSVALLAKSPSVDHLIANQCSLLMGMLGFHGCALGLFDERSTGYASPLKGKQLIKFDAAKCDLPTAIRQKIHRSKVVYVHGEDWQEMADQLGVRSMVIGNLRQRSHEFGIIILGSDDPRAGTDPRVLAHLEAVVDQIALLISTYMLQEEVSRQSYELDQTHDRLIQSEKLGVVGTLAASTAHDIRNILSSLSMELSASEADPIASLESVKDQLQRFSLLSHRLLSYAKPHDVATEPMRISDVLTNVSMLMATQMELANVSLEIRPFDDEPTIKGDPHQLEHVFVNLFVNAINAMPGGGRIEVKSNSCAQRIQITVGDTGKGFQKDPEEFFKPFESTRAKGFGLGLFSCRGIVEEHGGTIAARNGDTKGGLFTIELPL